jgi:hypothetical protein
MQWGFVRAVLLGIVLGLGAAFPVAAIDVAWMRTGVRAWYFGGVETGGPTSSDAEEAYLLGTITGNSVEVTHHSALTHWTSPKPTIKQSYSLQGAGTVVDPPAGAPEHRRQ